MASRWITWSFLCLITAACAAPRTPSPQWQVEPTEVEAEEVQLVLKQLPRVVDCILAGHPERCGITDNHVEGFSPEQLRSLFGTRHVMVRYAHTRRGEPEEINVLFLSTDGRGVVSFVTRPGAVIATSVTHIVE